MRIACSAACSSMPHCTLHTERHVHMTARASYKRFLSHSLSAPQQYVLPTLNCRMSVSQTLYLGSESQRDIVHSTVLYFTTHNRRTHTDAHTPSARDPPRTLQRGTRARSGRQVRAVSAVHVPTAPWPRKSQTSLGRGRGTDNRGE